MCNILCTPFIGKQDKQVVAIDTEEALSSPYRLSWFTTPNSLTNHRKSHILIIAHLPCVEGVPKDVLLSKASFAVRPTAHNKKPPRNCSLRDGTSFAFFHLLFRYQFFPGDFPFLYPSITTILSSSSVFPVFSILQPEY